MGKQLMMYSEEDHLISATSMYLVVLCTFTITKTTLESLMKRLMMDSFLHNCSENRSFPDDEFLIPRSKVSQSLGKDDYFPYVPAYGPLSINNIIIPDYVTPTLLNINSPDESHEFTIVDDYPIRNEPGEPLASVTTRSRIRDSEVASAHECLYVNFLSEIETKKLIEAFEDE
ncbi:hypothetical protein Tco_1065395 [Tanacetum coccineum]